ncbi:hypothetical protein BKI52_38900 [marine bacterium AO1-C]|nr:hypothetical protein BKI52_38900 [marine bacterium AO1-C]
MPVYSLTSRKTLSTAKKQQLVDLFTDAHCSIMVAPEQFVHVLFSDGIPIFDRKSLYIHANVRQGRTPQTIEKMRETLIEGCAKILNVKANKIHINILEIQAKWIMEGGYIMPDPGEEDEWMEKVTKDLAARENSLVQK